MPRSHHRLSDLEQEAQQTFYLVVLTWNDGVRTAFAIQSPDKYYAVQAAEAKALNMWDGFIVSNEVFVIPIPTAPNLPEHVYTDQSSYKVPEKKEEKV